jgi:hypothetical protein
MNAWDLSSSGLIRVSSLLKTWMPDQVGHDNLFVIPAQAGIHVFVIPAHAGIHAFKKWMPDQVGHDSFDEVGHDSLWGSA